nr:hypothetical protein [Bradyrhizobium sp. CCBAU 51753]
MDVARGHEAVLDLEIAASGPAQSGYEPGVVNADLGAIEVAAQRRAVLAVGPLHAGEPHEPRRMMRAAAERPAPADAVAALDLHRRSDRTGGAGDEGHWFGEPAPHHVCGQVAADPAHAGAVADQPADRAVKRGRRLHDGHEVEWREFRPAERLRQIQPKQSGLGQRPEDGIGEPALAIEMLPLLGDQRRQPRHRGKMVRNTGFRACMHDALSSRNMQIVGQPLGPRKSEEFSHR